MVEKNVKICILSHNVFAFSGLKSWVIDTELLLSTPYAEDNVIKYKLNYFTCPFYNRQDITHLQGIFIVHEDLHEDEKWKFAEIQTGQKCDFSVSVYWRLHFAADGKWYTYAG